jgi:hypothetical protein
MAKDSQRTTSPIAEDLAIMVDISREAQMAGHEDLIQEELR